MSDIDTEKIEKIAQKAVDLHAAQCPVARDVAGEFQRKEAKDRARHDELVFSLQEVKERMLEGGYRFKAIEADQQEDRQKIVACTLRQDELESTLDKDKTAILVGVIRFLVVFILGGGVATGVIKAIQAF